MVQQKQPKRTYPKPAEVGPPPVELCAWIDRVVLSWNLTPKEHDVCEAMMKGLTTKEIAAMLGNTDKTLKHHIAAIFGKAHVSSRSELFAELLQR